MSAIPKQLSPAPAATPRGTGKSAAGPDTAWDHVKRILKPLASLRITVVLLVLSMLLVYAGTCAQVDAGIWAVQKKYFHSLFTFVDFRTLNPRHEPGLPGRLGFWMPGGYLIGVSMLVNLLAAHMVRFKLRWNRAGILMIHLGLVLLVVGEALTSVFAVESHMQIAVGAAKNYSEDTREVELAIVDRSPKEFDNVAVIPQARLKQLGSVTDAALPFEVRVDEFYPNTRLMGPREVQDANLKPNARATAGGGKDVTLIGERPVSGTNDKEQDVPGGFVTLARGGRDLGTYLVSLGVKSQQIQVDGKPYDLDLRFKRLYKPYIVFLKEFTHKVYPGTTTPRDFASTIHLTDPTRNEERDVRIWMNNPLRYNGETFYQSSFMPGDQGTVLQIVRNPAAWMPYVACIVGGLGLMVHFLLMLGQFINRQTALPTAAKLPGNWSDAALPAAVSVAPGRPQGKGKKAGPAPMPAAAPLKPFWLRPGVMVPAGALLILVATLIVRSAPPKEGGSYDLTGYGKLPVVADGRTQPLDSLARNTLRAIRGKESFVIDDPAGGRSDPQPAVRWIADVANKPDAAAAYKVFRIDYPDLANTVNDGPADQRYFSLNQVLAHWSQLAPEMRRAGAVDSKKRDQYQAMLTELAGKVQLYFRATGARNAVALPVFTPDADVKEAVGLDLPDGRLTLRDVLTNATRFEETVKATARIPEPQRTPLQKRIIDFANCVDVYYNCLPNDGLLIVPPAREGEEWSSLERVRSDPDAHASVAATADALTSIQQAYKDGQPAVFNAALDRYRATLDRSMPAALSRVDFEAWYNRVDPPSLSAYFYVFVFLLAAMSWMFWRGPLGRASAALLIATFLLHTACLVGRMYISGRPPVTNLASSAIFIAWGAVLLCIGIELFFRNSIATAVAAAMGAVSLLIYINLAKDGDTITVMQAVLDTNGWLATHVVAVTLGYASTFLAGCLGLVFIGLGVFTPVLDKEASKTISRWIYGITCFAMFFSFVGTVLGGIWADQSWGRFWGWDPKENGAVLIVLSNALLLHARWSGLVRARGIAVMAVFGNIITAWSWFGTNMLGIGLHAYGFMERGFFWLTIWIGVQIAMMCVGMLPQKIWLSNQAETLPTP